MNSKSYKISALAPPETELADSGHASKPSVVPPGSVTHMLPAGRIATLRLPAVAGARYVIVEDETGRAPQQIHARRRGNDLLIHIEDYKPDQIDLILEDFYALPRGTLVGLAENDLTYPFIPSTAEPSDDIVALADGVAISQVLGSGPVGLLGAFSGAGAAGAAVAAAPTAFVGGAAVGGASAGAAGAGGGLGLGAVGAGGLAAAALGAAAGGGSPDATTGGTPTPSLDGAGALTVKLTDSTNSGPKNDTVTNVRRPTLTGTTVPGNMVMITNADGQSSPAYVDGQGNWTWTPAGQLADGSQSFKVIATNGIGSTERNVVIAIQTTTWGAGLADNLAALEAGTGNVKPGDNKLNITEFANGLTVTFNLTRDPSRELSLNDLSVTGDAQFQNGSFRQINLKTYTVVVEPKASNNNGSFNLSLLTPADLTDLAGNAFAGASPALSRSFDTVSPKLTNLMGSWTDSKADNAVNLAESVGGIAYTASFSEALSSPLAQTDFSLTNGSIRVNSFAFSSQTNSYRFIVDPTPNTAGQLQVKLRTDAVFKDSAGNALDTPPTSSVTYDLIAPALTIGSTPASTLAIQVSADTLVPYTVSGQSSQNGFSASILGQSLSADAANIKLPAANVAKLAEGYYTVTASAVDDGGNPSNAYQVLKVSRNTLPDDHWVSGATPPTGSNSNDVFINRAGSQSFTGGSGADKFFWLKRDAGITGKPDVDVITDFTKGSGNPDSLNIADLLGTATGNNFNNLGLFVRSEQVDQNNNPGTGSTRLLISSSGKFDASNIGTSLSVADQVILLQGVVTTVDELSNSNQLVWQAFWA